MDDRSLNLTHGTLRADIGMFDSFVDRLEPLSYTEYGVYGVGSFRREAFGRDRKVAHGLASMAALLLLHPNWLLIAWSEVGAFSGAHPIVLLPPLFKVNRHVELVPTGLC